MTKAEYKSKCETRWYGGALMDALLNFEQWEEMRDYLTEAMRQYRHNPFQQDLAGKCWNEDGSLYRFLWKCQEAQQPDRSRLDPFLDFEEHYQKIFLRRGLEIYCREILDELQAAVQVPANQENLFTKTATNP